MSEPHMKKLFSGQDAVRPSGGKNSGVSAFSLAHPLD